MAYKLKEVSQRPQRLTGGHRMCAGCGAPVVVRCILSALKPEDHAVIGLATGCLEVSTWLYPFTAWEDSVIHNAFENVSATLSGAEAAYKAAKRMNRDSGENETKFVAFGGDGGTYDIGIQSLSGALERGHDMLYVCYDNGAYMNTGIQRSSATPEFANTTTSPVGKVKPGKYGQRKDLTKIAAAHNIPYVAQSSPMSAKFGGFKDLYNKAEKAIYTSGPTFLNTFAPCPRGWRYSTPNLMEICDLAVNTCVWPLYEIENGELRITYEPKTKLPVEDYLKQQGRFSHMFKRGNEYLIEEFQNNVDKQWERLKSESK